MSLLKKKNSSTSMFKQKNTPEFVVKQEKMKQSIVKSLSRAIKVVQFQFTNKDPGSECADVIGDGRNTQQLCTAFEDVLKHGLKSGWFGQTTPTFWPIVLKISRTEATKFIGTLQHAQSESAKCRGWIRLAVNESSLASYLTVLCQDKTLLSSHYETYSFVRDPEMVSTLTELLGGISLITFKLTVDVASLAFDSVPEAHSIQPVRIDPSSMNANKEKSSVGGAKKSRRRREHVKENGLGNSSPNLNEPPPLSDSTSDLSSCGQAREDEDAISGNTSADELAEGGCGREEGLPSSTRNGSDHLPAAGNEFLDYGNDEDHLYVERNEDSVELDYEYSDDDTGWKDVGDVEQDLVRESPESALLSLEAHKTDRTLSLTNLVTEVRVYEEGEEFVTFDGNSSSHNSLLSLLSAGNGLNLEEHVDSFEILGDVSKERQDTLVAEDSQGSECNAAEQTSENSGLEERSEYSGLEERSEYNGLEERSEYSGLEERSEYNGLEERSECSGIEDDTMLASINTLTNSLHFNPFNTTSNEEVESGVSSAQNNPFVSYSPSPPVNPFGVSPRVHDEHPGKQSTNPFYSSPYSAITTLSNNPFCANEQESFNPSPTSHSPHSVFSSPLTCDDPLSVAVSTAPLAHDDPLPIFTGPLACEDFLPIFQVPPLPPLTPPPSSPSISPLLSAVPSHSASSLPLTSSPHTTSSQQQRPGSSSSSSSSSLHPHSSRGLDDLESYSSSSIDISFLEGVSDQSVPFNLASPDENHFQSEKDVVDMQLAIDKLKVELTYSEKDEFHKETLRKKLVDLQMKQQQLKEKKEDEEAYRVRHMVTEVHGHELVRQLRKPGILYHMCECCGKKVRGILHTWYLCKRCGFAYHSKCIKSMERICSANKSSKTQDGQTEGYILEVCPEKGLTAQNFRCNRCNVALINTTILTRLCDYCGFYFCFSCHRNDQAIIPARVLHNWDFIQKKVCCRCCDLLERFSMKPLLRVQPVNPLLYTYVQDLSTLETMRKDLLVMKSYFMQCPKAKDSQLLKRLDNFPHFKDGAKRFSLTDLHAIYTSSLLPQVTLIHREFISHIKLECPVCSGKGFLCALCKSEEVLYPFDRGCKQCPKCHSIFHRNCYSEMSKCPKCQRIRPRHSLLTDHR